jgi:hypothetical protein
MLHKSNIMAAVVCASVTLAGLGLVARQMSHANAAEPGSQEASEAAEPARRTSIDHMKQIMLAFHNYYSANDHFPPRAIFGADGEPKLSWRVALLPFLDQGALFQEFHLNEAWDSPHNWALIARMPDVFATPSSPTQEGTTRIRLFEGPGTMFDGARGMEIKDMTDGTSNTVAIVVGRDAVTWTRPGELPFAKIKPLTALDETDEQGGVLAGTADGAAHYLSRGDEALWRKLITPAGGEFVDWSAIPRPVQPQPEHPPLPTPAVTRFAPATIHPVPASPISPDLEARLRAIETKLERILRKLEAGDHGPAPR